MKGLRSILFGCLALLVFPAAVAVDDNDTARAAARHGTTVNTPTNIRQTNQQQKTNSATRGGRGTTTTSIGGVRDRTVATGRNTTTQQKSKVTPRNTTTGTRTVSDRVPTTKEQTRKAVPKTTNTVVSRTATKTSQTRTAKTTTRNNTGKQRISRAATDNGVVTGISAKYSQCRQTFYDCMDEFCANKDTQLKRCACSSRYNEFDKAKKQLSQIEEKMLDFNQRLLTVNMDAEDVEAMMKSTEGEDAFYDTKDKTKSKKMLDDIAKKLNNVFGDDQTNGMNAINLSLNTDSAFDSVDSMAGASTTTKSGTGLYRAALPVCREMVLENCSNDELSLAESGYQMLIEQDCNTVSKAYQSKNDDARTKVKESSALLDISRLDIYQKRNSDDLLTCKKKMLDMLSDNTVCGKDLVKCLDPSGQYIDPATGSAVLTQNLVNFSTLITRPTENETWTGAGANAKFVTYLNDKKLYLEPAMENCQDIADNVWKQFIPDALAQIKIAQDAKMEEIRRACTSLTTECISNASESITEFDARALSVFGVSADKTANTMCADVKNSCAALLADSTTTNNINALGEWDAGMSDIATKKTYDTIISSCTQVGRNCIVQTCKSISGNFTLCENINTSPNRHSILNRTACWNEVIDCVGSAGDLALNDIMLLMGKISQNVVPRTRSNPTEYPRTSFYREMYGAGQEPIYDICGEKCPDGTDQSPTPDCLKCRIAEQIWGNCEDSPDSTSDGNKILKPLENKETLLYWFAENTGTAEGTDGFARSCVNTRCSGIQQYFPDGHISCSTSSGTEDSPNTNGDNRYCPTGHYADGYDYVYFSQMTTPDDQYKNCCWSRQRNTTELWGNNPRIYVNTGKPTYTSTNGGNPDVFVSPAHLSSGWTCDTTISQDNSICLLNDNRSTNLSKWINNGVYRSKAYRIQPNSLFWQYKFEDNYGWNGFFSTPVKEWHGNDTLHENLIGGDLDIAHETYSNICCTTGQLRITDTARELCLPSGVGIYKTLARTDDGIILLCVIDNTTNSKNAWYCEGTDTNTGECGGANNIWSNFQPQDGDYPHGKRVDCPGTLLYIDENNLYQLKGEIPGIATNTSTRACGQQYTPSNYYYTDGLNHTGTPVTYNDNTSGQWDSGHGWFVDVKKNELTPSNALSCSSYSNPTGGATHSDNPYPPGNQGDISTH